MERQPVTVRFRAREDGRPDLTLGLQSMCWAQSSPLSQYTLATDATRGDHAVDCISDMQS
jgi:hypothetical protein